MRAAITLVAAMLGTTVTAVPAAAQNQVRVAIGSFTSTQSCQTYVLNSGSVAAAAAQTRIYGVGSSTAMAYAASWRQDLVTDCVDNFPELKASLASALAASGAIAVVPAGTRGALVLNGRISEVVRSNSATSTPGANQTSDDASMNVEFTLLDRGVARTGGTIVKRVNVSSTYETQGLSDTNANSTSGPYSDLQREAALAVARSVSFSVAPPYVITTTDRRARINYGTPLVTIGMTVLVDGGPAAGQLRLNVASAADGFADLESEAGVSLANLAEGSIVTVVESDDPASNMPRTPFVPLP